MRKSSRIGFQVYPPLTEVHDLIRWDQFIDRLCGSLGPKVISLEDKIVVDVPGRPSLVKDGFFFRQLALDRNASNDMIAFEIVILAASMFPGRVFAIDPSYYTQEEMAKCHQVQQSKLKLYLGGTRHCAYCLESIRSEQIVVCAHCKRRSYCSETCRETDRSHSGQSHALWCSQDVCEEDLDWELLPVDGKGLGIVAKRFIPRQKRIMIDTPRPLTFPPVLDLEPLTGTVLEKERLNSFHFEDESLLFVRVARINHSCRSNACQAFEDGRMIISSLTDIEPGEEICINYTNRNGKDCSMNEQEVRHVLLEKWGIRCSDDCACRDDLYLRKLMECRYLDAEIADMLASGVAPESMKPVETLISILLEIRATWGWVEQAYWNGFHLARMSASFTRDASRYGLAAMRLRQSILNPDSQHVLEMKVTIAETGMGCPDEAKHAAQSA